MTDNASITLKDRLTKSPVTLAFPDWQKGFILQVDASTQSVGGVLSQRDDYQNLSPIAYFSTGLTPAQKIFSRQVRMLGSNRGKPEVPKVSSSYSRYLLFVGSGFGHRGTPEEISLGGNTSLNHWITM